MSRRTLVVALLLALGGAVLLLRPDPGPGTGPGTGTGPTTPADPAGTDIVTVTPPASLSGDETIGKRVFEARCAACHGINGAGVEGAGPPLVHKTYEPSHHGDMSFQLAVSRGVRAHHWRFGDMPPQPGLTEAEVGLITRYIRRVQQENGIR